MKKILRTIFIVALVVFSVSLVGCKLKGAELNYDDGVVKAFNAVSVDGDVVSQTAIADGSAYLVTVITPSSITEYTLDSEFNVGETKDVSGKAKTLATALAAEGATDLERAYSEALKLSGIDSASVTGFDFDRDTYLGDQVYKVEIEDEFCEYTYVFRASDFELLKSETELKQSRPTGESSYIGEDKAKQIAFDAVNVSASSVTNLTVRSILDEGRKLYKVRFDNGEFRYDVDIEALGGAVVKLSKTTLRTDVSAPEVGQNITEEQAKQVALEFAFPEGINESEVSFRKVKLDYEKGKLVYEVEFVARNNEYEFEIDASDGTVIDVEIDGNDDRYDRDDDDDERLPQTNKYISREDAIAAVKAVAGEDIIILEVDIDKENLGKGSRYYYEIDVKVGGREAEYFVDAETGEVTLNEEFSGNPLAPSLSEADALKVALDSFGLTEDMLTLKTIKLEREDGRLCYEIELFVRGEKFMTHYEMTVDANTGKILDREVDIDDDINVNPSNPDAGSTNPGAGSTKPDAGSTKPDTGSTNPDAGNTNPDVDPSNPSDPDVDPSDPDVDPSKPDVQDPVDPDPVDPKPDNPNPKPNVPSEQSFLTVEQVREKIYEQLGNNVRIEDIELKHRGSGESRRYYYEVEVEIGGRDYDYFVDAVTGEVTLKGEFVDANKELIGEKRAKEIALAYFTLSEKEIRELEIELDEEHGRLVYEVEFEVRDIEYTVEIDALTGEVVDFDISFD